MHYCVLVFDETLHDVNPNLRYRPAVIYLDRDEAKKFKAQLKDTHAKEMIEKHLNKKNRVDDLLK